MTTTAPISVAETYPHYATAYAGQTASDVLAIKEMRERGWEAFNTLGLPTARRGNEPWKYTNAGPIARESFSHSGLSRAGDPISTLADVQAVAPWQPDWRNLVVVDGAFAPVLSTGNTTGAGIATGLADAVHSEPKLAANVLGQLAPPEEDGFAALNAAFVGDGVGIYVPAGVDAGVVNVIYLTTGRDQPRATHPRTVIAAEPNSRVTVIETFAGPDTRYLTNTVMETSVGEGASVEHYRLLLEGSEAYHVGVSRVVQQKDSSFSSVALSQGAALGRNDFGVTLAGTGAQTMLNGLYLTKGNQHIDNYINIDHAEPYGTSRLFYKGILGRTVSRRVRWQQEAEVDSKPSLLIYADDVKCGHGATAGHIDVDTVFYMRSRGLDLATASRILIQAFAREIIDTVALEPLRDYLDQRFQDAIPSANIALPIGGRS
ncbi:UPF0051 protein slr0076 [Geodia barretti]|uniref:UPF0051 protein slr0076 n=1 Tax=Geodia barretti TaxID=519541 RepID=A0AA35X3R6_GEOBA|nr:UPF0051 protein slr0076 [Geodia barretti]